METKIIMFGNLKGGVGKSILTSYFANYLAAQKKMTLIIDGDVSQHTSDIYDKSDSLQDYLSIIKYNLSDGDIGEFVFNQCQGYDYVLVDIPGTIQQDGIIPLLSMMDKIIIPTSFAEEDISSSIRFVHILNNLESNLDYKVLINKYEVQYSHEVREAEKNGFVEYESIFGEGNILEKGIRVERSLLQNNFKSGEYDLTKRNAGRVNETMDLIYEFIQK